MQHHATMFLAFRHLSQPFGGFSCNYRSVEAMSQDSMVGSLPSNGWSCETLGRGVTAAAAMAGLALQPEQLKEVLLGGNSGSHIYNSFYISLALPSKSLPSSSIHCWYIQFNDITDLWHLPKFI